MDRKKIEQASRRISDYIFGFGYNEPWKLVEGVYREFRGEESRERSLGTLFANRFQDRVIKTTFSIAQIACLYSLPQNHELAYASLLIEALRFGAHRICRSGIDVKKLMAEERAKGHEPVELEDIMQDYDSRCEAESLGDELEEELGDESGWEFGDESEDE